jgi:hypothetical protein
MPIMGVNDAGGKKPDTPTSVSATAGNAAATVTFLSAYKGKTGTATFTATSSPGGVTGASSASPITVSGLSNGTAYTFTVYASAPYGVNSDVSSASSAVTPVAPVYYAPPVYYAAPVYYSAPVYFAPTYYAPEPTYFAPTPTYFAPEPTYFAPTPTYFAPEPTYFAPEPTYYAAPGCNCNYPSTQSCCIACGGFWSGGICGI